MTAETDSPVLWYYERMMTKTETLCIPLDNCLIGWFEDKGIYFDCYYKRANWIGHPLYPSVLWLN